MQQFYGTGRDSERQRATLGESERHGATPCFQRDSERKPATIVDRKRHAATLWDGEILRNSQQPWETLRNI